MSNSLFQNAYYIGIAFNGILYGIELVLYVQTMQVFFHRGDRLSRTGRFIAVFNTAILLLVTIFVAVQAVFGQEMWLVNAGFEGGSATYLVTYNSVWYRTLGTTAWIVLQLMSDVFLIYRCFIVCNDFLALIFLCILWVTTLVFGILHLCYPAPPSGGSSGGLSARIGVTYVTISVGLNVFISCMICARVAYLRKAAHTSHTSEQNTAEQKEIPRYKGTVSIPVEAALLYAISGIAFVVSYGIGSGISILFLSIYIMCACLSSQFIITRIAGGRAWKRYGPVTSSTIGLRDLTSTEATGSSNTGTRSSPEVQFRDTDSYVS